MSYPIYTTEGIILKKRDLNEADRIFSFFTQDFGRVQVIAQGVRYLKSKLRYGLSGLSFLRLGFVGTQNNGWRLVDVDEIKVLDNIKNVIEKQRCALRILVLVERLVQGQERDAGLWEKLKEIFVFLEENTLDKNGLKGFETSAALQIIAQLGYIEKNRKYPDPASIIRNALEQSQL